MPNSNLRCRLIVLHYNRCDLLRRFMPSVIAAARQSQYDCRVTLLDNASTDDSVEYARKHFPDVEIYVAKENRVLCSFNDYVSQCQDEIVILLNNDMELDAGFVDPLVAPILNDPDVFFVSTEEDRSVAAIKFGLISADITYLGHETLNQLPGPTFSAGVAAFDRKKYLELGGYDELYLPGRYEDVDLSYRGWKRGWKGVYQPASKKKHEGGASFDKAFTHHATQTMVFRNALLFTVKNISDPRLFLQFLFWLPIRLIGSVFLGKWFMWQGFFQFFRRLPAALQKRSEAQKQARLSDREVIRKVNQAQQELMRAPSRAKRIVNFLGRHAFFRMLFFGIGFFTVRLTAPLQYLILRELMTSASVLDLGCGKHSMVPIIPTWIYTVGVEIFEPYYQAAVASKRHKRYLCQDLLKSDFPEKSFDTVVLLDVLEHLTKENGTALLNKIEKIARKKIVIFTPNGFLPQDDFDENPYMDHCSGWVVKEFRERGYQVAGVRGFKSMYGHDHDHEDGHAHTHLADFGQILTYHFPEAAFQLFCVKKIS